MKPDRRFINQPMHFWANVRSISEAVGYTSRKRATRGQVKVPLLEEMEKALQDRNLQTSHVVDENGELVPLGTLLLEYYKHRADILNNYVEPRLMDVDRARQTFEELRRQYDPKCPIPMNKQKGEKKSPAFFTGIINMLIEANIGDLPCDYDPQRLTTITRNNLPLRTLARRVDGAFPGTVNPIAIWEIKEYYYTTTFGSRVADSVYETLLDGMELEELLEREGIKVRHYMIVDDHFTWWDNGRSYLCRLVDMLHMGYVDEVLFGYEVIERLPALAREWANIAQGTTPS